MTDQNYYDTLGLDETSSFEEIQAAKDRLIAECEGDRRRIDAIEAAYDAILMERLRLRQEGKLKVPDRIRFAEEPPEKDTPEPRLPSLTRPGWLSNLLDTPSRNDVLLPAGIFAVLALLSIPSPSLALAIAVGATVYFLNRKEYRFWRSVLLTILGLTLGLTLGILLGQVLAPQLTTAVQLNVSALQQVIAAIVTTIVLWATSSFLR
jgi:hypothetical protein